MAADITKAVRIGERDVSHKALSQAVLHTATSHGALRRTSRTPRERRADTARLGDTSLSRPAVGGRVQQSLAGGPRQDRLGAGGQIEPVPVEDHVVAEDVMQTAFQDAVAGGVGQATAGCGERIGPGDGEVQRSVGAKGVPVVEVD